MLNLFKTYWQELFQFRHLIFTFVLRDLKARYKQTHIGIAWAIIQPLFMTIVFSFIFSKFLTVSTDGVAYPAFSYIALAAWTFIARCINVGSLDLIVHSGLIKKIYFPREIIPFSTVVSSLMDFGVACLLFVVMMMVYKLPITIYVVFLPFVVIVQVIMGTALALVTSGLTVIFRDLQFVFPFLVQICMYASPVVYSIRKLQPQYQQILHLNPVTGVIEGYRSILLYGEMPNFQYLSISFLFSVITLLCAYVLFKRIEKHLADVV